MEAVFQDCIHEVKAQERTVLLSSHILAEVEALCDRLSIIRLGRTVETGTLDELRHLTRTSITAETVHPAQGLADLEGIHDLEVDGAMCVSRLTPIGSTLRWAGSLGSGSGAWSATHPRSRSCSCGITA